MSWLLIVIIVILAISVIQGLRKGLVRTIVSTFFLVFVMAISVWMAPHIEDLLDQNTKLPEYIEAKCESFLNEHMIRNSKGQSGTGSGGDETSGKLLEQEQIESLPIPDYFKRQIAENNNKAAYQELMAQTFTDYVRKYLSGIVLYIISFAAAFILSVIILEIILKAVDVVTELPLIGFANRLGGAAAGVVRALLWVWIFFAILMLFANTQWGRICMQEIERNSILSYMYTHNLLLDYLLKNN
ncbi:CvpA family protein [Novisyntrophococcus fermenticellae]|uniref:CvpA family protein n=1 Tax=Novisyntrophococcus fermenticellae TaxID=2068655 RepID=UPI001E49412B|nr:CvpA family protein [Novisyntrophococcus fermenticellae]